MINENQAQSIETDQSANSLDKQRERHKELSITVRRTMFTMLAYSVSCGVIIAQPDVPFVLTSSGVQLPVINVAVNLKAFLIVGPLGLIAITTYLHIFLDKLNHISELNEYDKQPFLFNFRDRLSRLLGFLIFYATPPIVMVGFSWKSAVIEGRNSMYIATIVVTAGMIFLYLKSRLEIHLIPRWFITIIIIGILSLASAAIICINIEIGYNLKRGLNLERANLVEAKLMQVDLEDANLKFADLSGANLTGAFLYGANLYGTIINDFTVIDPKWKTVWKLYNKVEENKSYIGVELIGAYLCRADLRGFNLSKANLGLADLRGADLREANLDGANLDGASLSRAELSRANLSNAGLNLSYLREANLSEANLYNSNLGEANLDGADLSKANVSGASLRKADLRKANLNNAGLNQSYIGEADLREADLREANLSGADLREADLREAKNLTASQLCSAKTLYKSIVDSELEKQVKKQCPDLLKEP